MLKSLWRRRVDHMATLQEQINEGWKAAMRSGDTLRRDTLSGLRAAIKNWEIQNRTASGAPVVDDAVVQQVIDREAKKRRDAIEEYNKVNRPDRAAAEQQELDILQEFLPPPLTVDEVEALAREAIAEAGATRAADMGRVMQLLMPRLAGRADGKQASVLVRQMLS